jgi:hypothetical protein
MVHAGAQFAERLPDALEGRTHLGGKGTPTWPEMKIQQPACVSMRSASLKLGAIGLGRCCSKSMASLPKILLFYLGIRGVADDANCPRALIAR